MQKERRTTRNGVPGKIIRVAPKKGYDRFVRDRYRKHKKDNDWFLRQIETIFRFLYFWVYTVYA